MVSQERPDKGRNSANYIDAAVKAKKNRLLVAGSGFQSNFMRKNSLANSKDIVSTSFELAKTPKKDENSKILPSDCENRLQSLSQEHFFKPADKMCKTSWAGFNKHGSIDTLKKDATGKRDNARADCDYQDYAQSSLSTMYANYMPVNSFQNRKSPKFRPSLKMGGNYTRILRQTADTYSEESSQENAQTVY